MTANCTPEISPDVSYVISDGQLLRLVDGVQEDAIDCCSAFGFHDEPVDSETLKRGEIIRSALLAYARSTMGAERSLAESLAAQSLTMAEVSR